MKGGGGGGAHAHSLLTDAWDATEESASPSVAVALRCLGAATLPSIDAVQQLPLRLLLLRSTAGDRRSPEPSLASLAGTGQLNL